MKKTLSITMKIDLEGHEEDIKNAKIDIDNCFSRTILAFHFDYDTVTGAEITNYKIINYAEETE
jgi:hypothetical protein